MFSTGQLIFAVAFAISFFAIIVFSYRKDKKIHTKNYKGVIWIALLFLVFIGLLFIIKEVLKN